MKNPCRLYLLLTWLFAAGNAVNAQPSQTDQQAAEQEIRATADAFVALFKKRDAAAIAALWTPDGVYTNEDGERFEGRASIQSEYEMLFQVGPPDLELRLEIDAIRLINSQTAIEVGRAALTPQPPGEVRVMSRYTAIHVKQDGQWLMADVRDTLVELPPDPGELEDLEWLVGTWTAATKDAQLQVTCRWIEDQHFLARAHQATESGKATSGGLEIIGLDPSTGQITSWSFTNDGGHAVGTWAPHENGWTIDSVGVMNDGTETAATYILSRKDNDTLLWKSLNRMVDETLLPDTDEIELKRSK